MCVVLLVSIVSFSNGSHSHRPRKACRHAMKEKNANVHTTCCAIYVTISVKCSSYIEIRKSDCYTTLETWLCIAMNEGRLQFESQT